MGEGDDLGPVLRSRLTYLLKRAVMNLEDLHAELLASSSVNARELSVLLLLNDREPESQQQVARRLGVDRTSMVGLLDGLERKGFLARQADADDRRRNVLVLTADGKRTLKRAKAASDTAEQRLLDGLTPGDAQVLRDALSHIAGQTRTER